jgi:hypothetical protein
MFTGLALAETTPSPNTHRRECLARDPLIAVVKNGVKFLPYTQVDPPQENGPPQLTLTPKTKLLYSSKGRGVSPKTWPPPGKKLNISGDADRAQRSVAPSGVSRTNTILVKSRSFGTSWSKGRAKARRSFRTMTGNNP